MAPRRTSEAEAAQGQYTTSSSETCASRTSHFHAVPAATALTLTYARYAEDAPSLTCAHRPSEPNPLISPPRRRDKPLTASRPAADTARIRYLPNRGTSPRFSCPPLPYEAAPARFQSLGGGG